MLAGEINGAVVKKKTLNSNIHRTRSQTSAIQSALDNRPLPNNTRDYTPHIGVEIESNMSRHASLRKRAATVAGRSNGATRTMKTYGKTTLLGVALASLTVALILVLTIGARDVHASPMAHKRTAPTANDGGDLKQSSGDYNNLDTLISEFLDDRLKKSKQNSVRQIKQTLRFGRRSDPLMMPVAELERERDSDLFDQFGGRPASFAHDD